MFLVPTYLARSSIHGIGVFTPTQLPTGTLIWTFDPQVDWRLTAHELSCFPEPFRAKLLTYCYREPDGAYVLCGDNAKFMNHALEPNCDDSGDQTIAVRDIDADEELTCDYRAFDADSAEGRFEWLPAVSRLHVRQVIEQGHNSGFSGRGRRRRQHPEPSP